MFRPPDGPLGVDGPVVPEQHPQPGSDGAQLGQGQQVSVERERTLYEDSALGCRTGYQYTLLDIAVRAERQGKERLCSS